MVQVAVSTVPKSLNGRASVRPKSKKGKASQPQSPQQLPTATMQLMCAEGSDRSLKEVLLACVW